VICVGATGLLDDHKNASSSDGQHGWGSSYIGAGPDVMAPGPWSYTTDRLGALGYNTNAAVSSVDVNYTHDFGGTSSSTPKVAGIAALVLSVNPGLSPAQVKSILQSTAHDIDTPGPDDRTGYGRVDALAAVLGARPTVSISDAAVAEGALGTAPELTLTVSLSFASGQAITVDYATVDGTATASSDYLPNSGKLYFPAVPSAGDLGQLPDRRPRLTGRARHAVPDRGRADRRRRPGQRFRARGRAPALSVPSR
jgi:subtilisin family serine protease